MCAQLASTRDHSAFRWLPLQHPRSTASIATVYTSAAMLQQNSANYLGEQLSNRLRARLWRLCFIYLSPHQHELLAFFRSMDIIKLWKTHSATNAILLLAPDAVCTYGNGLYFDVREIVGLQICYVPHGLPRGFE